MKEGLLIKDGRKGIKPGLQLDFFGLLGGRFRLQIREQGRGQIALAEGRDDHHNILPFVLRATANLKKNKQMYY